MWSQSRSGVEGQELVEVGVLLAVALLAISAWRRYRRSGLSCPALPFCGSVYCPSVHSCSSCSSCGIYTPHISPRRSPWHKYTNPCSRDVCTRDPCPNEPCAAKSSSPIDGLLCLRDLAKRSVRFYLGESSKDCQNRCSNTLCEPDVSCKKKKKKKTKWKDSFFSFCTPSKPSWLQPSCSNACYRCGANCSEGCSDETTAYEVTLKKGVMSEPVKTKVKFG